MKSLDKIKERDDHEALCGYSRLNKKNVELTVKEKHDLLPLDDWPKLNKILFNSSNLPCVASYGMVDLSMR